MNREHKICQNCKTEFTVEPDDFIFYEKIKVPPPAWCPHCRMMRRFLFRNHRMLFRKKDEASGKEVFSSFPADAPVKIYEHDYWWSDKWDARDYGKDYDFSRPFFEQFRELLQAVPLFSRSVLGLVNSDYSDQAAWIKNCYLCFDADEMENSAYVVKAEKIKESFDLYEAIHDELCYECVMADENYQVFFSLDCDSCHDVWFSKGLSNCTNCFGCVNLRRKSYYIFNEPYSREAYIAKLAEFQSGSHAAREEMQRKAHAFWLQFPVKFIHGYRNINSTGEHIQDTKNVRHSYSIHHAENVSYSQVLWNKITDSYDYTNFGLDATQVYESVTCGWKSYRLKFCWECWNGAHDMEYAAHCPSSAYLFGCVGMQKKSYCILNKQYTEEEYGALREKIIRHMQEMPYTDERGRTYRYGEFFPPAFSPFAYNEIIAQDFFPRTKEEAERDGYGWREPEAREYQTTVDASALPDHIKEAGDTVTKEIIACASCKKAYRIIPMELAFLRRMSIPLPRFCPNCRFRARMDMVNPPQFWHRKCQCAGIQDERGIYKNSADHFHASSPCPNEFETSYAPDRKEIVYCEACYLDEVV